MMTKEELAKLPKWAQEKILSMRITINRLSEELKIYEQKTPESNTWVDIDYKTKIYLPDRSIICFKTKTGIMKSWVQHEPTNGEVYIDISGDGVIYPVARNVIKVIPKGRW